MKKNTTPPLPEPASSPASTRPLLSDKNREKYLKALTELVGMLSINTSRPVEVADFCQRHDLRTSFFEALRDLDALVFDFTKTGIDETYYKATEKLVQITPEQLLGRMRGLGGRADRTPKAKVDKRELISTSGLVQQSEPLVAEKNAVVVTENQSAPAAGIPPVGPKSYALAIDDLRFTEAIIEQELAALDYLAQHLSMAEFRELKIDIFYKLFTDQNGLLNDLARWGMVEESDEGKYPMFRITPKLMAAIQQKTLHPVIIEAEPQTMGPVDESTTVPEPTPLADKLKSPSADCSTSMCALCADDSEKRVHLMSKSVRPGVAQPDPFDEDEIQRRLEYEHEKRRTNEEFNQNVCFASQGQPERISPGADFAVQPLQRPYNIDIEAHDLRLNMNVSTTEDAAIVDAITFKLKRQTVAV